MRKKRKALNDANYRQSKLILPTSLVERLKLMKTRYKLRGLDDVCNALLHKAIHTLEISDLNLQPLPSENDAPHRISVHVRQEHLDFIEAVTLHLRGATNSVAFESIAAQISDLEPPPIQLSFIKEDDVVSG